jgi:hypothetical protein
MNQLQRASVRRKVIYVAAILVLFSLTLFWRGKLTVPFGNPARAAEQAPTALNRTADTLARAAVQSQAERLELRELDQGDPEIAASAARSATAGRPSSPRPSGSNCGNSTRGIRRSPPAPPGCR